MRPISAQGKASDWMEGRLTATSRVGKRRRAAANPRAMQGYAAGR
jgi:gamma-glutamyltranspeptidase / glutathione hydrolase